MTALDIDQSQVLIDFFSDPNGLRWHHRVLFHKGERGSWVVGTPDLEVEQTDLGSHKIRPLRRGAALPPQYSCEVYVFDQLTEEELRALRADAASLASVLGFEIKPSSAAAMGRAASWRLSDASLSSFAEVVPKESVSDPDHMVIRGSIALVLVDGQWVTAEKVEDAQLEAWRAAKVSGPNRDPRLAGDDCTFAGGSVLSFRDGIARYHELEFKNFPFRGPRLAQEFMMSMYEADMNFVQHHMNWRVKSGVAERSSVCRVHKSVCDALHHFQSFDQLNRWGSAGIEQLVRQLHVWETATRRNPKAPDFEGLDVVLAPVVDEAGSIQARTFGDWVSQQQKTEAQVLKGARLWREEKVAATKAQKTAAGGAGPSS